MWWLGGGGYCQVILQTKSANSFPPDDLATFYGAYLIIIWINSKNLPPCKLAVGRLAALMANPATLLQQFHLALSYILPTGTVVTIYR